MVKIQQIESPISDVGIIYAGLVAHYCDLITKPVKVEKKPILKEPILKAAGLRYRKEIQDLIDDPWDFLKDKRGREVFAFSEIADYLSLHPVQISYYCPIEYCVAEGKTVCFRGVANKSSYLRGVSIKNHYMWHVATRTKIDHYLQNFKD